MNRDIIIEKYAFNAMMIKCVLVAIIVAAVLLIQFSLSDFFPLILLVIALDLKHPLVLKNYFLIYTSLLFFLGGGIFYSKSGFILRDGYLIIISFLLGYYCYKYFFTTGFSKSCVVKSNFIKQKVKLIERAIMVSLFIRVGIIGFDIWQHGFSNFFAGDALIEKIDGYGKENFIQGLVDIFNSIITTISVTLTILYVSNCLRIKDKLNFKLISIVLIGIPLISLSRNSFAFGVVSLLLIYSVSKNNFGRITRKMAFSSAVAIFSLLFIATFIGGIRSSRLAENSGSTAPIEYLESIYGELSPIQSYYNINEKIDALHYQYGMTIFPPLLFKVIPRSWYPDKPINSTAYYSLRYDKANFDSGFMMPSTLYGDLFLNFGLYITLLLIFLFGVLISFLDYIYLKSLINLIYIFLIVHMNFYGLLRNNIPEGIFAILQGFLFYYVINLTVNSVLYMSDRRGRKAEVVNLLSI